MERPQSAKESARALPASLRAPTRRRHSRPCLFHGPQHAARLLPPGRIAKKVAGCLLALTLILFQSCLPLGHQNCRNHKAGDHCEMCARGLYRKLIGLPRDCTPCTCPHPPFRYLLKENAKKILAEFQLEGVAEETENLQKEIRLETLPSIFIALILNFHHRKNTQDLQEGIHIGEKLDVRKMEGFVDGGQELDVFPSVLPLDPPSVQLG
ncbi:Laminin subunit alpha-1 [Lemmus lemmus]